MSTKLKTILITDEVYTFTDNIKIALIQSNGASFYITGNEAGSEPVPIDMINLINSDFDLNGLVVDATNTEVSIVYSITRS